MGTYFGNKIKEIRKKNKLTQLEFAKIFGYKDKSMIAHIENGDSEMSNDKIALLIERFGIDANELFVRKKNEIVNKPVITSVADFYNQYDEDKELLLYRINLLLEHIDLVLNDTKGLSISDIEKSSLLLRATCFSIAQIGEMMNQLEKELSPKYDQLPWINARKMRNVIVHDCVGTAVEQVYSTIHNDLPALKVAFIAIKNDLNLGILSTERLILRKLTNEDADSIYNNWANDPEVTKYMTWNAHESIEDTKQILDIWLKEYKEPKTVRYGIVLKENNELIGAIDVVGYIDKNPEIGYCLSRKYWNKGYMTEACKTVVKYLFAIGYKTILIEADERNIGSNRVIEKVGFKFTYKETKPCSSFKPDVITVNWYKITN